MQSRHDKQYRHEASGARKILFRYINFSFDLNSYIDTITELRRNVLY